MSDRRSTILERLREAMPELRSRFGVRGLSVFGFVARDEATDASDVDVVVEFEGRATFDAFMDLKFHLEDLLETRVDLVTERAIRPSLRPRIEREAVDVA